VFTVALLTALATSVHNGALTPPAVFSATSGTPWTLAGVVGHEIEAYVEVNDERIAFLPGQKCSLLTEQLLTHLQDAASVRSEYAQRKAPTIKHEKQVA
jgi:hypothetical protein